MDREVDKRQKSFGRIFKWPWIVLIYFSGSILLGSIKSKQQTSPQLSQRNREPNWISSYGLAPHPGEFKDPVIQVYAARTRGSKKALAVHTWIATKRRNDDQYTITQVLGWRLRRRGTSVFSEPGVPDKSWYGNPPTIILDLRGEKAEKLIDKIDSAAKNYPWANRYTVWPGPNSNTFIAWLGLEIPELRLDLPSTAIGKDWRPLGKTFGLSASGTGVQASLYGLLGASIGLEEGLEINVLGLSTELDIFDLALEIPGYGRISPSNGKSVHKSARLIGD